jgi:3'-5' exoribonuclease
MFEGFDDGDVVSAAVNIKSIVKAKSKQKKDYIRLTLNDGTNDVLAFVWDTDKIDFKEGDTVKVKGTLGFYNDKPKLDIINLSKSDEVIEIKLPSLSNDDIKDLIERFESLKSLVDDNDFSSLLDSIFNDAIWEAFITAPAAKGNHQAYIGGLLEHSVAVAEMSYAAYKNSPENVNVSLLIAGGLLHDIGKIKEYSFETIFDRTTVGKLVGHTTLGVIIITKMLPDDFPPKKFAEIVHLILSHHGKRDWGAPVEPLMKEAVLIHQSDMINSYSSRIDTIKLENKDKEWSEFDTSYARSWYMDSTKNDEEE